MIKLGVMLSHLGNSQLNYEFFKSANQIVTERADVDIVCFFEQASPPMVPLRFATMAACECKSFDGVLISTNMYLATLALQNINATERIFFSYDLDWMRGCYPYRELAELYRSEEHRVFVRSHHHSRAMETAFGRLPYICPSFDIKEILQYI